MKEKNTKPAHDGELITLPDRKGRTPLVFGFRGWKDRTVLFLTQEEQIETVASLMGQKKFASEVK